MSKDNKKEKRWGRFFLLWMIFIISGIQIGQFLAFGQGFLKFITMMAIYTPFMLIGSYLYSTITQLENEKKLGIFPLRNIFLPWPRNSKLLGIIVIIELVVTVPMIFYEFNPCGSLDIVRKLNGCVAAYPHNPLVVDVSFTSDGRMVASADLDGKVRVFTYPEMELVTIYESDVGGLTKIDLSSTGEFIGINWQNGSIRILKTDTGEIVREILQENTGWGGILFTPDDKKLIVLSETEIQIWDVENGNLIHAFQKKKPQNVIITPDGELLASEGSGNIIEVWNLVDYRKIQTIEQPYIQDMEFSPDGKHLVTAVWDLPNMDDFPDSGNSIINILNIETGAVEHTLIIEDIHIVNISVSSDGSYLVGGESACWPDGILDKPCSYVLQLDDLSKLSRLFVPYGINSVEFSPNSDDVLIGSYNQMYIWKVP